MKLFFLVVSAGLAWAQKDSADPEILGVVTEAGINHGVAEAEIIIQQMTPGAVVSPLSLKEVGRLTTDSQGKFSFHPEKLGEYMVRVNKEGYKGMAGNPLRAGLGTQANVVLNSDHPAREVRFVLGRPGELTGQVLDEDTGQPLTGFQIQAAQLFYFNGAPFPFAGALTVTDADGRFVARGLTPGPYIVKVSPRTPAKEQFLTRFKADDLTVVDQDYERSYWPGGHELDVASPVTVVSGGSADVGTIKLRKTPFYRVHVSLGRENCAPDQKVQVFVSNQFRESNTAGDAVCGQDFLLRDYQPGSYTLHFAAGKRDQRSRASLSFELTDKNLEYAVSLERGLDMDGRLVLADGVSQVPFDQIQIRARPLDSVPYADEFSMLSLDAKGRFHAANMPSGRLQVSLNNNRGYIIKEVRYNGSIVADNIVTLNPSSAGQSLEIVVDDQPATINGVVNESDRPVRGPWVVLSKWPMSADLSSSPPQTAAGDDDGKFQFTGLPPGEYRAIAVSLANRDKLDEPEILQRGLSSAEKVTLSRGGLQTLALKLTDPTR